MVEELAPTTSAKAELRTRLRALRRTLTMAQRAAGQDQICRLLSARFTAQPPLVLASYAALVDELSLDAWHAEWWADGNTLWFPRVHAPGELSWHPVTDPRQLRVGAYGIREPQPALVPAKPLPLTATLLVPGVAFTADGWRLGQGGGFYDRLLSVHQGPTIGLAFSCQRLEELPRGPHDRRVSEVLFSD